jgi:transposase-like protein
VARTYKPRKVLTPDEVVALVDAYQSGKTIREAAEEFGVSVSFTSRTLQRLSIPTRPPREANLKSIFGILARRKKRRDEIEPEVCRLYQEGVSGTEIARRLGISDPTVYDVLAANEIEVRVDRRVHSMDETAFDRIGEDEGASYFAGLLFADGCILVPKQGQRVVQLSVSGKDSILVDQFQTFLKTLTPTKTYQQSSKWARPDSTLTRVQTIWKRRHGTARLGLPKNCARGPVQIVVLTLSDTRGATSGRRR